MFGLTHWLWQFEAGATQAVGGPYRVENKSVFRPGERETNVFRPGERNTQLFRPGERATSVYP